MMKTGFNLVPVPQRQDVEVPGAALPVGIRPNVPLAPNDERSETRNHLKCSAAQASLVKNPSLLEAQ